MQVRTAKGPIWGQRVDGPAGRAQAAHDAQLTPGPRRNHSATSASLLTESNIMRMLALTSNCWATNGKQNRHAGGGNGFPGRLWLVIGRVAGVWGLGDGVLVSRRGGLAGPRGHAARAGGKRSRRASWGQMGPAPYGDKWAWCPAGASRAGGRRSRRASWGKW